MASLSEFSETTLGRNAIYAGAVLLVLVAGYVLYTQLTGGVAAEANGRVFIDKSTGKSFNYELKAGDSIPIKAPSGAAEGYPAEACFWTKEGTAKEEPTYVLVKEMTGETGPTFCPDCGRLVVVHNPRPSPDRKAPPTQAEYEARRR